MTKENSAVKISYFKKNLLVLGLKYNYKNLMYNKIKKFSSVQTIRSQKNFFMIISLNSDASDVVNLIFC